MSLVEMIMLVCGIFFGLSAIVMAEMVVSFIKEDSCNFEDYIDNLDNHIDSEYETVYVFNDAYKTENIIESTYYKII